MPWVVVAASLGPVGRTSQSSGASASCERMSFVTNPLVSWLLSHAYGQGGTVAVPSPAAATFQMPKGEFPAGIDEVLAYLSSQYASWAAETRTLHWCFLVGGPGNGKSEALRTLAE